MAYCALTDLDDAITSATLLQLSDDNGDGVADADAIAFAVNGADGVINSHLQAAGFSVPVSPVPALIKSLSIDITIYNLYSRKPEQIPEVRQERYKNAIRILDAIAKGTLMIGSETPTSDSTLDQVSVGSEDRIFTRTKMTGY